MMTTCTNAISPKFARRILLRGALGTAGLVACGGVAWAQKRKDLVLAFIPQENPEKLLGDIKVITAWLAKEIGQPVRGFVTSDHAAAVEALRNGDADVSFMGALPYVIANELVGAVAVLSEIYRGKSVYTGRIFVRRDSGIKALSDLRAKSVAFADPISESGYLYPLDILVEQGLLKRGEDPKRFFGKVFFAGGYQQAMQAMAAGLVDAAGASQYAESLLTPEQQANVTWIAESKLIPSHTVIVRKDIDAAVRAKFVAAMLKLNEPEHRTLLKHVYGPEGYVAADLASYDGVRNLAKAYGLLN